MNLPNKSKWPALALLIKHNIGWNMRQLSIKAHVNLYILWYWFSADIWAFLLCCDSLFCSLYQVVLVAMPTFMLNWEFGSLFFPCFVTSIKRSRRADSQHATSCQKSPSFELGIILQWSDSTNHRTNMPTKLTYQVVYSWKLNLSPPSVTNQIWGIYV